MVKWVQYSLDNITSHVSFSFYSVLHDVNTNLKLWSLIRNFNQPIITFIKCGVSKVLAAYITSALKPSIKHSTLLLSAVTILDEIKCHILG